jgi:uroporphyrin-III C-methyltransferase
MAPTALLLVFLFLGVCGTRSFRRNTVSPGWRQRPAIHLRSVPADEAPPHGGHRATAALGKVALVGAGPGDPELLTLQALRVLKQASLVISDRLVSQEILDLITCEVRIARKRPGCAEEAQDEIYEWTKEAVLAGRDVVRLKIGDPFLFGRGGEEVLEFRKLGVEPTVVPGVSSSYSAPLAANIPLTHRGVSNSVLISTGYGRDATVVDIPPYASDRTVVLLMAVGRIAEIASNMTAAGYPKTTPVAIVEKATTPEQRTLTGTLETIGEIAKRDEAKAPAAIIIGEVVNVLRGGEDVGAAAVAVAVRGVATGAAEAAVVAGLAAAGLADAAAGSAEMPAVIGRGGSRAVAVASTTVSSK